MGSPCRVRSLCALLVGAAIGVAVGRWRVEPVGGAGQPATMGAAHLGGHGVAAPVLALVLAGSILPAAAAPTLTDERAGAGSPSDCGSSFLLADRPLLL